MSLIPSLISAEQENCTVYLSVIGDYGNIIATSLSKTLSNNGFKIIKTAEESVYIARAIIELNAIGSDPITIYLSLDLKINGKDGKTVFVSQCKAEQKSIAYTLENAQKKAYPILSKEAEKSISEELNR